MGGVNVQYTRELRERFGYSATWLPTIDVRLGDVGVMYKHEFERVRSLEDYNICFETRHGSNSGFLDYTTYGAVTISVKAAGELPRSTSVLTEVDAGIAVSFSAEDAIFFQASDCTFSSIEDQHALGEQLLALYEAGKWEKDYVVVTEVLHAECATVLISNSKDASIELKATANTHLGEQSLVDVDTGLQVIRSKSISTKIVGQCGLTPLFKACGVRKRLLRSSTFGRRGRRQRSDVGGDDMRSDSTFFGEVDYDSFDKEL